MDARRRNGSCVRPNVILPCVLFLLGAGAWLCAFARDVPLVQHTLDASFPLPQGAIVADIDGDGHQDVVAAGQNEIAWWDNTAGNGTAWTKHSVATVMSGMAVAVADVNGDGHMDIIAAAHDSNEVFWCENTAGDGTVWVKHTVDPSYHGAVYVSAADVDGDGRVDIIAASYDSNRLDWWRNMGGGSAWVQMTVDTNFTGAVMASAADVNGDGHLDIIGAGANSVIWWQNTAGDGTNWVKHTLESTFLAADFAFAADVDGDGDLDIVCTSIQQGISWWENTAGNGTAWTRHYIDTASPGYWGVFAADMDGDGDLDLVTASDATGTSPVVWWENTAGNGSAWTMHTVAGSFSAAHAVFVADIDGDGTPDVLADEDLGSTMAWWQNQTIHRSAVFPGAGKVTVDSSHGATFTVTADLNRDGRPDVVGSCCGNSGLAWWQGPADPVNGTWTYHSVTTSFQGPSGIAVADVDGDGVPDIVAAGFQQGEVAWFKNNGGGLTWTKNVIYSATAPVSVAVADINRDGRPDVVCSFMFYPCGGEIDWFENGGGSTWTKHTVDTSAYNFIAPAVADINRDGALDIVCASDTSTYCTASSEIDWWANNGSGGGWTKHAITTSFSNPVSLAVADFNRDGAPDVLAAGGGAQQVAWWANDGSGGGWVKHAVDSSFSQAQWVGAADLDGDGDVDAFGCTDMGIVCWWEDTAGDGSAWTRHTVDGSFGTSYSVGAADVDRDGRLDLFGGSQSNGVAWWRDLGGQFALPTTATAPAVAAPGQIFSTLTITMDHRGRTGDHDEELSTLDLLFETSPGVPMTSSQAGALFTNLSIYLDDGSGTFNPADTLVKSLGSFTLASGVLTVPFTHNDPNVQVPFGTSKTFFAVLTLNPALEAATAPANSFRLTHITETCSSGVDRAYQIPLVLEYGTNVATQLASIALTYTWDGGGSTNNWSEGANWTGDLVPSAGCAIRFDGTSSKAALEDASFQGTVASLTVDAPYGGSITQGRSLSVTGDFLAASGSFNASGGLSVGGDFTCSAGVFNPGGGSVTFDGSGPQNVDSGGSPFYNLVFDNTGGDTIAPAAPLTVQNTLHVQDGTLQASGDTFYLQVDSTGALQLNGTLAVRGNWSNSGSFAPGGQTVLFRPAGSQTASGSTALQFDNVVVNDGLLGYWKLDDASGSTAADASGFNHPGTLYHGPTWSSDVPVHDFRNNGSLRFGNPTNADYVAMTGTTEINGLQQITVACWVKLNTMPAGKIERFVTLVGEKAVVRYNGIGGAGQLQFYMTIGGGIRAIQANGVLSTGSWLHVAGTYDGTTMHMYLNGAEVGTPVTVSGSVGTGGGVRLSHPALDENLDGWLDDVRIYNRALTLSQIQSLAAGDVPSTSSGSLTFTGPVTLSGGLTLGSGTLAGPGAGLDLSLAGDLTRDGGVFNAGSGMVTFAGATQQQVSGPLGFYGVTISNPAGAYLWSNTTIGSSLALDAGDLDTGTSTLTLGASETSAGDYDVVGTTLRSQTFTVGTAYSFGSPYVTLDFTNGTPPTAVQVSLAKTPPSGLTPAVQRSYTITPTGGSGYAATVRLHYRDEELDGTLENNLQLWRYDSVLGWSLQGRSAADTTQNWVEMVLVPNFSPWALSSYGAPPGEASKPGYPLTATKGADDAVNITYTPAGCAMDHTVYWGTSPFPGYCSWDESRCLVGISGSAVIGVDDPPAGHFAYFVVVGDNGTVEGSYGKDSAGNERQAAGMIPGCHYLQQVTGTCP